MCCSSKRNPAPCLRTTHPPLPPLRIPSAGFAFHGSETMISGVTGEPFPVDIYIGVVYYQRLRHMVSDKFQVRGGCCLVGPGGGGGGSAAAEGGRGCCRPSQCCQTLPEGHSSSFLGLKHRLPPLSSLPLSPGALHGPHQPTDAAAHQGPQVWGRHPLWRDGARLAAGARRRLPVARQVR